MSLASRPPQIPPKPKFHWPHLNRPLLPARTQTLDAAAHDRKNRALAILAYILFVIPMLFVPRTNEFVWFHIRQSFGVFIASVIIYALAAYGSAYLLALVLNVALGAIWLVGLVYAYTGKTKTLPVFGYLAEKFKIF